MISVNEKKSKVQLTGLWKKEGKNGSFLAGNLNVRSSLLIFPNGYKQKDSDPDYIAYIAENDPREKQRGEINESDIPF